MRLTLDREQIKEPCGLEIAVTGFQGDTGNEPVQVFIEFYNGKLAVHVWDGSKEDCDTYIIPEVRA